MSLQKEMFGGIGRRGWTDGESVDCWEESQSVFFSCELIIVGHHLLLVTRYCPLCLSKASSQSSRALPKATIKRSLPSPPPTTSTNDPETSSSTRTNGRPKRKVAENQPDYHALHNHISTPTAKWLALIKEPKKTGRVISERECVAHLGLSAVFV